MYIYIYMSSLWKVGVRVSVCMYVCVCGATFVHACACVVCKYVFIHVYTQIQRSFAYLHTTQTSLVSNAYTSALENMSLCTHTWHIYAYTHNTQVARNDIHTCLHMHTYIHACIHTYIHTYIHTWQLVSDGDFDLSSFDLEEMRLVSQARPLCK